MPAERDPDLIKRAPGLPTVDASSVAAASDEAAAAEADARTSRSDFRSVLGRFATPDEIKYWVGAIVVIASFIGVGCVVVADDPATRYTTAAWGLFVTIASGALGLFFINRSS
jgi:hypothetical protein